MTIYQLNEECIFPNPMDAEPEGLLAIGGDLSFERILLAYSMGIFPWYSPGQPILWWSPDPRFLLEPESLHISKSLKRTLKSKKFEVAFDTRFEEVIRACAKTTRKGQDGTWITTEMIEAYCHLHELGFAHSVETYFEGELIGGLYGVSLGNAFFGESMFSKKSDASKVALCHLCQKLTDWNFSFIDCQMPTNHLKSLGGYECSRIYFLKRLNISIREKTHQGFWT